MVQFLAIQNAQWFVSVLFTALQKKCEMFCEREKTLTKIFNMHPQLVHNR